jgi:hypothetical protein
MAKQKINRLASVFADFANRFELPHKVDRDGLGADLGIPDGDRTVFAGYAFAPSEDSYDFGAVLGQVDKSNMPAFSSELLSSEPIRGITERIDDRGRIFVVGNRDGLQSRSDVDIQKGYMDDVSRISKSSDQFKSLIRRVLGEDD